MCDFRPGRCQQIIITTNYTNITHYRRTDQYGGFFFSSNNLHLQSRMWKLRVPQMPSSAIFFRYIATLLYKDFKSSHQAHLKGTCALGETGISVSIYVDFVPDQKSSAVECGRGRKSSKSDQWRVRKKHQRSEKTTDGCVYRTRVSTCL